MRVKSVRLGMAVTIANQTEQFFNDKQNKCVMEWDKGLLSITAIGRSEDSKAFTIFVPSTNIAWMAPYEDGEVPFEIVPQPKKK